MLSLEVSISRWSDPLSLCSCWARQEGRSGYQHVAGRPFWELRVSSRNTDLIEIIKNTQPAKRTNFLGKQFVHVVAFFCWFLDQFLLFFFFYSAVSNLRSLKPWKNQDHCKVLRKNSKIKSNLFECWNSTLIFSIFFGHIETALVRLGGTVDKCECYKLKKAKKATLSHKQRDILSNQPTVSMGSVISL